jgi:hypothetical protein
MRRFSIVLALLALGTGALFAQSAEQNIIGIENGVVFAYNLGTDGLGVGQETAINLSINDNLQAGFVFINGDGGNLPNQTMLRLHYLAGNRFGVSIGAGTTGGNALAMLGLFGNIFSRTFQDTLYTALGFRVDYMINTGVAVTDGILSMALVAKVGM